MDMICGVAPYVVGIVIGVIVVQYAFAIFCLLKLAYFDIPKKQYVLWNLFILIVFFIGGAVFLGYFYKHRDKHIKSASAVVEEPKPESGEAANENSSSAAEDAVENSSEEADGPNQDE